MPLNAASPPRRPKADDLRPGRLARDVAGNEDRVPPAVRVDQPAGVADLEQHPADAAFRDEVIAHLGPGGLRPGREVEASSACRSGRAVPAVRAAEAKPLRRQEGDGIAEAATASVHRQVDRTATRPGHVVEIFLAVDAQDGPRPLPARLVPHVAAVAKRRRDPVQRQRSRGRHQSMPVSLVKCSHLPVLPERNPNAGAECPAGETLLGKGRAGRWVKIERDSGVRPFDWTVQPALFDPSRALISSNLVCCSGSGIRAPRQAAPTCTGIRPRCSRGCPAGLRAQPTVVR